MSEALDLAKKVLEMERRPWAYRAICASCASCHPCGCDAVAMAKMLVEDADRG